MDIFDLVKEAQKRLHGHVHVTPVMTSQTLNQITSAQIFLKCENFQRMGAFKFRGAFNAMSQLTEDQKKRGVITYSSGNHAQAVALVGRLLGIRTVIVMPNNAPVIKREATEAYGATVVRYDPEKTTREKICGALENKHGHTLVPPYDHINIVAGQGEIPARYNVFNVIIGFVGAADTDGHRHNRMVYDKLVYFFSKSCGAGKTYVCAAKVFYCFVIGQLA